MTVTIIRKTSKFNPKILPMILIAILAVGTVFGVGAVIKHLTTDIVVEPSVQVVTDMPNSFNAPAGNDYNYSVNITNRVNKAINYTVSFVMDGCQTNYSRIKFNDTTGLCNLTKVVTIGKEQTLADRVFIQTNTSMPSGTYKLHLYVSNDDFQYTN